MNIFYFLDNQCNLALIVINRLHLLGFCVFENKPWVCFYYKTSIYRYLSVLGSFGNVQVPADLPSTAIQLRSSCQIQHRIEILF